jgi:hypothetical protein
LSLRCAWLCASCLLATSVLGQQPRPAPPAAAPGAVSQGRAGAFWAAVDKLGVIFKAIGNLGGTPERGQVWRVDIASRVQHAVAPSQSLAWPVLAPDGVTVFALHDGALVRLTPGGQLDPVGTETHWRKLLGVDSDGDVLGFVNGKPRVYPAMMGRDGTLRLLPQPQTDSDRERVSLLLQENRAYADGRELVVKRSARGGQGFDVSLVTDGQARRLSDCGDDLCGQPFLAPDGRSVLYVRAAAQ